MRDFSSVRTVGAPFTAVVVAVATSAATAMVGAAMALYLNAPNGQADHPATGSSTTTPK